ncbi:MAG: sulfatase-like hydrolase/transferase [Acidobacteriota bacterium]|jgi:arylsulfatase A-like enzyme/predicted Zn-dependent protease
MSLRRLSAAALALLALGAAAYWWLNRGYRVGYPRANVVLVTIDTLRADRLGSYGHAAAQTPRLDRLAAEGVRFEQVVASVPLTLPSHTSIMSSMDPTEHGVRDNAAFEIPPGTRLLAEVFHDAGYDTGAFVGAYVLDSRWGLAPGFDTYDDDFDYAGGEVTPGQVERRGDAVMARALPWLRARGDDPFFAWIHLYDPHAPYDAPEPFASRLADPYDGEVAYTDSLIGELLDTLGEQGMADDTIVLVTADHGEALGDHGEPGHGLFLYDSTILVPLILRLPDDSDSGLEVPAQVRLIDVAPTLLELVGLPAPDNFIGASLVPFLNGGGGARPAYSETYFPRYHFGWQELHALREEGFKYIMAPRPELYDVATDAAESDNLVEVDIDRADMLREDLEDRIDAAVSSSAGRLSAEASQRLRALGYIGAAPADLPAGPLPDPKDKVELFRKLTRGQGLLQSGDPAAAEAVLEEVVAEDPGVVDAQFTLGNARFAQRDFAAAIEAFTATIALNPEYDLALSNLGLARRRIGDAAGAREDFEALLELVPDSPAAHYNLGEMDLEAGKPRDALQHFEIAVQSNDAMPSSYFGAGVASLQLGDVPGAQRYLERTMELAPDYPELHYYLALVAEAKSDPATAVTEYRTEVEDFPGNYRAWFNLSLLLADLGQPAEAVGAAQAAIDANPDFARAHVSLGRYLLLLNDPARYDEAGDAARRGLALQPEASIRALGHFVLADVYNRQGRAEDAQRELALARRAQQEIGG